MPRVKYGQVKKVGMSPGSPIYTGEPRSEAVHVSVLDFSADHVQEHRGCTVEDCAPFASTQTVTWINVDGVHDADLVQRMCERFGIHPLTTEDILSIGTRPKYEEYETYVFLVLSLADVVDEKDGDIEVELEQISIVIGRHFVITFQQEPGDVWDPVRKRIRGEGSRLRVRPASYLGYALMDAVVDHYFLVLDSLGTRIEALEDDVFEARGDAIVSEIHGLRRHVMLLRKTLTPLREVTGALVRSDSGLIDRTTQPYLRDLHDHAMQALETAELYREMSVSLLELYLAGGSNRLNQVMKVLTIIATIFIPITFVSSVYGMNFAHMPELDEPWAYPAALALMAAIAVTMVVWFRRQDWI